MKNKIGLEHTDGSEDSDGEEKRAWKVPLVFRSARFTHQAAVGSVVSKCLDVVTELLYLQFERGQCLILVVVGVETRRYAPQFTDRRVLQRKVLVHRLRTTGHNALRNLSRTLLKS